MSGVIVVLADESCFAIVNISVTAMVKASEVSFTSVITSLPTAGMTRFTVCGRTMRKKVCARDSPSAFAASCCPGSMESMPPR